MKTMSKNEFCQWLIDTASKHLNAYQFDIMYDIARIMNDKPAPESYGNTDACIRKYRWYLRKTGTWIVSVGADAEQGEETMKSESDICYVIILNWNCDYDGTVFAKIAESINH